MATLTVRDTEETLTTAADIQRYLGQYGIWYRRFEGSPSLSDDATDDEVLAAYAAPIRKLKAEGGYVTADVINIRPDIEGLQAMLDKFNKEHWHAEDEVRFIVGGRGLFHIHPEGEPVFSLEVVEGDMINVPYGTHHWFDLCEERSIRAIRLFQDPSGWTPHYTDTGEDAKYQPMCFGPAYFPPSQP